MTPFMQMAIRASCLAFTLEPSTTISLSALSSTGPLHSSFTMAFTQASLLALPPSWETQGCLHPHHFFVSSSKVLCLSVCNLYMGLKSDLLYVEAEP